MTITRMQRYNLAMVMALWLSCCVSLGISMAKEPEPTIGTIKWAIYETATSRLLSSGEKELHTRDVVITSRGKGYKKQIKLHDHFSFGLAESCDAHDEGFGLTGDRDDEKTFSWDWFNVDSPGHAKKLQESGELSFERKKTANGTEMSRMEFLTDISIRVFRKTGAVPNPLNPAWRIKISKGSVIYWPSLVNGKAER